MKSLSTVVCLFLVAAVVRSDSTEEMERRNELIKDHVESCAKEHNISPADIPKFDDINLEGEERQKSGCMKACIMQKMGIMDGITLKIENMKKFIGQMYPDDDKAAEQEKFSEDCVEEVKDKTDECDKAYEFIHCVAIKSNDE